MNSIREKFIELKHYILDKNVPNNIIIQGLDSILELLAEREYMINGPSIRWQRYESIHTTFVKLNILEMKGNDKNEKD